MEELKILNKNGVRNEEIRLKSTNTDRWHFYRKMYIWAAMKTGGYIDRNWNLVDKRKGGRFRRFWNYY